MGKITVSEQHMLVQAVFRYSSLAAECSFLQDLA